MSDRYKSLISPVKIRNKVLKSRFIYTVAQVHFLQGPEKYPADPVVSFFCELAKNGSALMIAQDLTNPGQRTQKGHDSKHFANYDLDDKGNQNYFSHFAHHVHCYGSYLGTELSCDLRLNYSVNDPSKPIPVEEHFIPEGMPDIMNGPEGPSAGTIGFPGSPNPRTVFFTPETMDEYIDLISERALLYKSFGYDAGWIDMSDEFYCGEFLSPIKNFRDDEYGGSFENRMKFAIKVVSGLRKRLGEDFILICNAPGTSGRQRGPMAGLTFDESVIFLNAIEPYVDIVRFRDAEETPPDECMSVEYSKRLKAAGVKVPIAVSTPYMDLDILEGIIARGEADFIASARMFICNENLGRILKNGNGEDLNPCLDCGVCRGTSAEGDWMSHCTINPRLGMAHFDKRLIEPVTKSKRVAIIGGGPGGVKCALWLKERGHEPVIFEKTGELGGQIKAANFNEYKWRLKRYLDFLKNQVELKNIELRLNTEATPKIIKSEGFDVVVAATGAAAKKPDIKGADLVHWDAVNIYGNEKQLGKRIVVIGGSSAPSEAAIHLAMIGRDVTIISRKCLIGYDLNPIRARPEYNMKAFDCGVKFVLEATTTKLEQGLVHYRDKEGRMHTLECDDIVAAGGVEPLTDEALSFYNAADEYYIIGDCREPGNMRTAIRDAYTAAMRI